jgi:hypothetical protein
MSLLLWFLLGELVVLAVGISLGSFILNRRRENRLHESVARLLQSILDSEPERLAQIQQNLLAQYPLSGKNRVEKLGQRIIEGEREFFRELVRILLLGDMNALPNLHQNLRGLMTRHMEILQQLAGVPSTTAPVEKPPEQDVTTTEYSTEDDTEDDLDSLLQAAAQGGFDGDSMLVAGGDDEDGPVPTAEPPVAVAAATPPAALPVADAEPDEEDDDLDALLQAAALGDFEADSMLVAGGDDEDEPVPTAEPPVAVAAATPPAALPVADAEPDEEDDDLDALLQAAALGDFDEDSMLVAGDDDEDGTTPVAEPAGTVPVSPPVTPPAALPLADAEPGEEDNDLDALLQAAALGDFDEEAMLVAGDDDEDEPVPTAESATAVAAAPLPAALPLADNEPDQQDDELDALLQAALALEDSGEETMLIAGGDDQDETEAATEPAVTVPAATPTAPLLLPDDEPDEDPDELDDELKALLQAALALEESGGETILIAGGDDQDETEAATEPATAVPATRPVPDEFDAMLDNLANRDASQAQSPATGGEALELDVDDILSDLALVEDDAAATDETPPVSSRSSRKGKKSGQAKTSIT